MCVHVQVGKLPGGSDAEKYLDCIDERGTFLLGHPTSCPATAYALNTLAQLHDGEAAGSFACAFSGALYTKSGVCAALAGQVNGAIDEYVHP